MQVSVGRAVAFLAVCSIVVPAVAAGEGAADPPANPILTSYDQGFRFATADKAFSLRLNGLLQIRWTFVDYDPATRDNQEDYSNFYIRRARLFFTGHAGSPRFTYGIHLQLEPSREVNAHDLWIEYEFSDLLRLGVGRNKIAYGLEMLNSGAALGMVERSVMSGETDIDIGRVTDPGPRYPGGGTARFGLSTFALTGFATGGLNLYRSTGLQLQGRRGSADKATFEYQLGVWQGRGTTGLSNFGNDHLVSLRVGYHPWGWVDWRVVGDIETSEHLKLGLIASLYRDRDDEFSDFAQDGVNLAALVRWRGWSADLEWGTESFDFDEFPEPFDREGWRASFGWFVVPGKWEVRARYAQIERLKDPTYQRAVDSGLGVAEVRDGDGWTPALEAKVSEISAAGSVFLPGWKNRLVVDVARLLREFAADPDAVIDGEPAPVAKASNQVDYRIRAMIQLAF
jgi:hypothetical protein